MSEKNLEKYGMKEICPVRCILSRIGDKWSVLILLYLGDAGVSRFSEIDHALGDISQKMLTSTLRSLESDGLVARQMYAEIPPRVEYSLTDLGRSLLPELGHLVKWAVDNFENVLAARAEFEKNKH